MSTPRDDWNALTRQGKVMWVLHLALIALGMALVGVIMWSA